MGAFVALAAWAFKCNCSALGGFGTLGPRLRLTVAAAVDGAAAALPAGTPGVLFFMPRLYRKRIRGAHGGAQKFSSRRQQNIMQNAYWRGFSGIFAPKGAPMLVF